MDFKEKCDYIITENKYLKKEDNIQIRDIVLQTNKKSISEHPDGIRIFLNDLPDSVINRIYNFIKKQLEDI